MGLVYYPDSRLYEPSTSIDVIDSKVESKIQEMIEVMKTNKGVGLAGVQIGYHKRIFITYVSNKIKVFINPIITWFSDMKVPGEEGCLSTPGVYAYIARPYKVNITALNEYGESFSIKAEKLMARVIQHEYEHLEGKMFFDNLEQEEKEKLLKEYLKEKGL
jgi:peptide deformylase